MCRTDLCREAKGGLCGSDLGWGLVGKHEIGLSLLGLKQQGKGLIANALPCGLGLGYPAKDVNIVELFRALTFYAIA